MNESENRSFERQGWLVLNRPLPPKEIKRPVFARCYYIASDDALAYFETGPLTAAEYKDLRWAYSIAKQYDTANLYGVEPIDQAPRVGARKVVLPSQRDEAAVWLPVEDQ